MLHGIPVICCDAGRILAYPNEMHIVAENVTDYYKKIQLALAHGTEKPNLVLLFKWFSFLFEVVQIDIKDVFKIDRPSYFDRIISLIKRKLGIKNLLLGLNVNKVDNFKNQAWLSYAIENQQESCLEERVKYLNRASSHLSDIEAERCISEKLKFIV
jgi:hypothetical protein